MQQQDAHSCHLTDDTAAVSCGGPSVAALQLDDVGEACAVTRDVNEHSVMCGVGIYGSAAGVTVNYYTTGVA